ncbi:MULTISPECIES: aldehyde dehydrogenase family protein [Brevibacillus]|jgi:acyl-CoA reductase-like NAD-dependent aldehyde dehydrogenase|uniref:Aldehyde dehydrogenase n=1 Tax=Brevibacillus aydinogluensis TaxID=927786 RepID=A0AA48RCR9_9BACL|nr:MULTISPECIES: aldehyde dehydrogenase family protein [Bacillales]REK61515.1 MAG: aldehyde dehydrogenase [Brevibacillus sp.]MBR8661766.1 aldehyde dehydrogenase family protein [Brevibacillus sp. NL20B1]MDT3416555.1 acyl-CoA reductase-like NAD-dependent aldehyde dehydrogenase [Brevibacillus aydinogluensis]UFJ60155.1 aldehyde dehydrogenase family protein [Anoxybacillus sediminis]CAJ1003196.1 Aldehyde dehydrogenase [Brevibacillus aydinogluensis]
MKKACYIGGQWVETGAYAPLYAPYSGEVIAEIAQADRNTVERAISAAQEAAPVMRSMPAYQRAAILEKISGLLNERLEEAAKIIAQEAGKPIKTARGEVIRTIQTYKFAAEEAKRIYGETLPLDAAIGGEGRLAYTVREPLGVIGAITPFNFPMNLVAHKVGPAIAAGNTVVLKPASQTPLSAFFLAELAEQAGLPAGALNIVTGSGGTVGDLLVTDPRVKAITFTGSPAVGINIRNRAGLKRVTLELGSNSAVIVDRDANLDDVIPRCIFGAFAYSGQVCISVQRIYVAAELYDTFVERFVAETRRLRGGDPLSEEADYSAMISPKETERVLEWIEEARQRGARVECGGETDGRVLQPTVLTGVPADAKISCQEVFGPIVLINPVESVAEAIALVNDSRYGLQAGLYTNNLSLALQAADALHVGGVMINDIPTFRVDHMPYGGVKESGMGREGVKYAIEEMTELKLVVVKR